MTKTIETFRGNRNVFTEREFHVEDHDYASELQRSKECKNRRKRGILQKS